MKIIKRGKIPKLISEPVRHTCSKCCTIFEFMTHEMIGGAVNCPVCGAYCYVRPHVTKKDGPKPWGTPEREPEDFKKYNDHPYKKFVVWY